MSKLEKHEDCWIARCPDYVRARRFGTTLGTAFAVTIADACRMTGQSTKTEEESDMSLGTPRELFVHELADMLSAEHIISGMLPELSKEAQHPELSKAFSQHEKETKAQIKRLEQIFKQLGEKPEETTCYATEGLKKEHASLHEEKPSAEVLEMAIVLGGCKTEHYEIASYAGLIQMAKDLGEKEVAVLLSETLAEEEAMAKQLTAFSKQLGKEAKSRTAAAS